MYWIRSESDADHAGHRCLFQYQVKAIFIHIAHVATLNIVRFQILIRLYLTKEINEWLFQWLHRWERFDYIHDILTCCIAYIGNTQLYDIRTCCIDDTWSTQMDSSILEATFELKSYLIN